MGWLRPTPVSPEVAARALTIRAARPDLDPEAALVAARDPCADIEVEEVLPSELSDDALRSWYDANRAMFGERSFDQANVGLVRIVSIERQLASVRAERAARGCPSRAAR